MNITNLPTWTEQILTSVATLLTLCALTIHPAVAQRSSKPANDSSKSRMMAVLNPAPIEPIEFHIRYPRAAKLAGLDGFVYAKAQIDTNGRATKVQIDSATDPLFIASARQAIMETHFTPARAHRQGERGSKKTSWWMPLTIPFVHSPSGR